MPSDVVLEKKEGWIVFSCPACTETGVFPPELVRSVSYEKESYRCPRCKAEVVFDVSKIEGTIHLMTTEDPALIDPLNVEIDEGVEVEITDVVTPHAQQAMEEDAGRDLILVVDQEETYRKGIKDVFSGLAEVHAFGGSKGAPGFIQDRAVGATLIIMDVFLGDGTFVEVLEGIKDNEAAANIPAIIVHATRKDRPVIEQMSLAYPQVKRIIYKEELLKRLSEIAEKLLKK
jgi:CheY-like chemotaxis protein